MNSVIFIDSGYLDWIIRNPYIFTRGLISRIQSGETDPYPGYSRWHGDALPGVQLAHVGDPESLAVILVGDKSAKAMLVLPPTTGHIGKTQEELKVLRGLADKLGYDLVAKHERPSNREKSKNRGRKGH